MKQMTKIEKISLFNTVSDLYQVAAIKWSWRNKKVNLLALPFTVILWIPVHLIVNPIIACILDDEDYQETIEDIFENIRVFEEA